MTMSINDLLATEIPFPVILIFIVIMMFAISTGIAMGKKVNKDIYGDDEHSATRVEKNVKIVARRTTPHPLNQALMINMVVFELADGNRVELAIKDINAYGIMVEGDCGTLKYQGKKFIDFERGDDGEA